MPRKPRDLQIDPFYLTTLERFSARLAHGAPAESHPDQPAVIEASYGVELVKFRIKESAALMSKKQRSAGEEERLRIVTEHLRAAATALRQLHRHLAPADTWSKDARPTALIAMWMAFLPQVKEAALRRAGKSRVTPEIVGNEIKRLGDDNGNVVLTDTACKVLNVGDMKQHAIQAITEYCCGERTSPLATTAQIAAAASMSNGEKTETKDSVRKAAVRYRTRPVK